VQVGSAETGHLSHAARGYFSELATAWERFLDRRRIRQCISRLAGRLSGCATHARSRWDGKPSGKNSLLSQNLVGSEFIIPRPFPFAVHGGTVPAPVAGSK